MITALILAAALSLPADCDLEAPHGRDGCTRAVVDVLPMNAIQAVGTHNSYKLAIPAAEMAMLSAMAPDMARSLDYAHAPLTDQLEAGARQLEIDVLNDPEPGLYASPLARRLVPAAEAYDLAPLRRPGLKVLHVQDVDYRSSCPLFVECLAQVAAWSRANPDHAPLLILMNLKEGAALPAPGAVTPAPFDAAAMDLVDAEIRSVFPPEALITPDLVRGEAATLRAAVAAGGWPNLGEARGKVMFALDAPRAQVDLYRGARASLEGRVLFVNIEEDEDAAAYITLNSPLEQAERIEAAIAAGLIVRTRADADTLEARQNDPARREAAFASGAQYVSTDYMTPDRRFSDFQVALPHGAAARLNPRQGLVAAADDPAQAGGRSE
ncbi:phosphatidylinositol-specific phospholipase C1-like protein [Phenylobacterium sp.]|uniref:phosphatidylinositol-specific phospholipase C1-like protein n=1 Tax=Phenylobacterium sp. TaxID=1871053 RepID=UPI00272FE9CF|nr:phosphatidylinositol-specific phospholipase C1-like protein [Phenylobacterium sp.]MDP1616890.1 phosphatidylinositol-specific phospholipase C1-like protein [Phenylobacterium sp.]MDP1986232.1 phosphatidylinositol-specific phospholipase C1-like protein [Phenylobacterium sp.]